MDRSVEMSDGEGMDEVRETEIGGSGGVGCRYVPKIATVI